MPALFLILLKINIALLLFSAAYYLILRRLTFYTLNRFFLALGIIFSTLYPFIDLTEFFGKQKITRFVPAMNQQVKELVPANFITQHWTLISSLFWAGVLLMFIRLLVQFISLRKMHRRSVPGTVGNLPVRILNEAISPFSFWQTIYINPSLHKEPELNNILAHEKVHINQWHTLDIILAELSVVFYWFNPGIWLMKKAVKENLEFITDEKVLRKGIDKKAYQYSLLDVGTLSQAAPLVNSFNLSDLKKRIRMMNAKRSSRITLSRYVLVLPVLMVTTLAFTVSKKGTPAATASPASISAADHTVTTTVMPEATTAVEHKPVTPPVKKQTTRTTTPVVGEQTAKPGKKLAGLFNAANNTKPRIEYQGMPAVTHSVKGVPYTATVNEVIASQSSETQQNDPTEVVVMGYRKPAAGPIKIEGKPLQAPSDSTKTTGRITVENPSVKTDEAGYKIVTGYRTPRKD